MNTEEIKKLVYKCLYDIFDEAEVKALIESNHDNGMDISINEALCFDSLSKLEFILYLEHEIKTHENGSKFFFEDEFIKSDFTIKKLIEFINSKTNGE